MPRPLTDAPTEPYWPAQACAASIIACYLALPGRLTLGPTWVVPVLAGTLLAGLVVTTRDRRPDDSAALRRAAVGLVALVSAGNAGSLALLVHVLVAGGHTSGTSLVTAGAAIWLTNVAIFALWYWELDGGGPGARARRRVRRELDWLFQQDAAPDVGAAGWRPSFVDYLYLSFTNATAFSPPTRCRSPGAPSCSCSPRRSRRSSSWAWWSPAPSTSWADRSAASHRTLIAARQGARCRIPDHDTKEQPT